MKQLVVSYEATRHVLWSSWSTLLHFQMSGEATTAVSVPISLQVFLGWADIQQCGWLVAWLWITAPVSPEKDCKKMWVKLVWRHFSCTKLPSFSRTVLQSSSSLHQAKKPVGCMRLAGTSHLQRGRWRCSQVMIQHRTEHSLSGIMSKLVIFPAQDLSISLTADSYPIPRGRSATQECHWADKSRQPTSTEINNRSRIENIWSADIWSELGDRISNILITSRNIISSRHLFAHSPCLLH